MSVQEQEWTPEFHSQRRPFWPGNDLAEQHGAYSPKRVDPLAAELVAQVLEQAAKPGSRTAYLLDVSYRPALWAWGQAEARVTCFAGKLLEHGDECPGCKRCDAWDLAMRRWQATATTHRQRLGLDPLSRAKLGKDISSAAGSVQLTQLFAQLAEQQRQRELQAAAAEGGTS
jgi:hypothetical protein